MVNAYGAGYGDLDGFFMALLLGAGVFIFLTLLVYVVTSFFFMRLLKNAGHNKPWAAWVPVLNIAAMLELAGFSAAWPWVGAIVGVAVGAAILSIIPFIGWLLSMAAMVFGVVLMIWIARGVQAGLGIDSTVGIVVAILIPIAWVIWMASASGKTQFNVNAAIQEAQTFPLKWFKPNPAYPANAFNVGAPAPAQGAG